MLNNSNIVRMTLSCFNETSGQHIVAIVIMAGPCRMDDPNKMTLLNTNKLNYQERVALTGSTNSISLNTWLC